LVYKTLKSNKQCASSVEVDRASGVVLRNKFKRPSTLVVLVSVLLGLAFVSQSNAKPAICGKLERQLASASSSTSAGTDKFSRAARAQADQLQIARGQARNAGCGGSFLSLESGNTNKAACARITSTIRRMEANLTKLRGKASGGAVRPNRSRILAALDANDCNGRDANEIIVKRQQPANTKPKEQNFLTVLFGGSKQPKKIETTYQVASFETPSKKKRVTVINGGKKTENTFDISSGTFRTLCVRTCDGYYFPVSFSTTSSRFANDEKSCATMCPGAETSLYYHGVPDQEPEEMISLRKVPYASMPTAFKYRRDGVGATPNCTCQAAAQENTEEVANVAGPKAKSKWVPYPSFKPVLLEDEETRINRSGGLDAASISELLQGKLSTQTLASQQNVRVVGPVFLPSQSKATDLLAPDRLSVQ
jgi:Protein of unknown function (DUF2865)